MDDLLSKVQTARTIYGVGQIIGGSGIAVFIFVFIFVFVILMSTPGLSRQQAENTVTESPSSFTAAPKGNIKFYCQYDTKWTSRECNITSFGCDPTSLAIILGSFGDPETPKSVATKNGGIGCSDGTTKNQTIEALRWVKGLGYKVAGLDPNEDNSGYLINDSGDFNFLRAKKFLDAGYLIHAGAVVTFKSNGIKRGGHSFVITDVNPGSKEIATYDPTECFRDSDSGFRTINPSDIGGDGTGNTWFWAFPVKKEGVLVR